MNFWRRPHFFALLLCLVYFGLLCWKQSLHYYGFWYGDFDLAIYYQGNWLLSQFLKPFVTVRGLPLLGDHTQFIHYFTAPLLRIYDSPLTLLFFETLLIAMTGYLIFLISLHLLKNGIASVLIVALFFSYPALQFHNLDSYRPETMALPAIALIWFSYFKRLRWGLWVGPALLLMSKETAGISLFGLGVFFLIHRKWKLGAAYSLIGLAATVVFSQILTPWLSEREVYAHTSKIETLISTLNGHLPLGTFLHRNLFNPENGKYLYDLFSPVGFLPFLNPLTLICSPELWLNMVIDWPYARMIQYHYNYAIIVNIFIALILVCKFISRSRQKIWLVLAPTLCGLLIVSCIYKSPISLQPQNAFKKFPEPRTIEIQEIKSSLDIVEDQSISVSHHLLPFFARRHVLLMWPNPFINDYYGILPADRYPEDPKYILRLKNDREMSYDHLLKEKKYRLRSAMEKMDLFEKADF